MQSPWAQCHVLKIFTPLDGPLYSADPDIQIHYNLGVTYNNITISKKRCSRTEYQHSGSHNSEFSLNKKFILCRRRSCNYVTHGIDRLIVAGLQDVCHLYIDIQLQMANFWFVICVFRLARY